MTTHNKATYEKATRRVSDAYCELMDALSELRHVDYSLYLVSLSYTLQHVRQLAQKENAKRTGTTPQMQWVRERPHAEKSLK